MLASCDGGNLEPVVVRMSGKLVPHVALYSKRNICKAEELTFMYGLPNPGSSAKSSRIGSYRLLDDGDGELRARARPCFCKTAQCLGYLPSDAT